MVLQAQGKPLPVVTGVCWVTVDPAFDGIPTTAYLLECFEVFALDVVGCFLSGLDA